MSFALWSRFLRCCTFLQLIGKWRLRIAALHARLSSHLDSVSARCMPKGGCILGKTHCSELWQFVRQHSCLDDGAKARRPSSWLRQSLSASGLCCMTWSLAPASIVQHCMTKTPLPRFSYPRTLLSIQSNGYTNLQHPRFSYRTYRPLQKRVRSLL